MAVQFGGGFVVATGFALCHGRQADLELIL